MKKEKTTKKDLEVSEPAAEATEKKKEKAGAKITKVGAMLKEMRQQKGVKLSDVSKLLCIRKFYLEAIESSDYETVPAFPYGIGFIRSYAKFLGLNSENIVELYKEETNASQTKDMRVLEPQSEASMPGTKYLIISILAIILVYAGWTMFNNDDEMLPEESFTELQDNANASDIVVIEEINFNQTEGGETISSEVEENLNEQPEMTETPKQNTEVPAAEKEPAAEPAQIAKPQEPQPVAPAKAEEPAKPVIPSDGVFVEVLKETWVEAKDETKLYLSKVLQAGDTYKVPNKKGMILSVGKDDGVKVYVNGVLTQVVRPNKKMNISLDQYLDAAH